VQKQRSILLFENSIKSEETREKYFYYLKKFKEFYKLRGFDSIIQIPVGKLQIMVEDYVMDLKKRVSPNSVPTPMCAIQSFLELNDIELRWKKIKRLYPAKVKKSGGKAWTTKDIQKMLSCTSELRTKAIVHLLASTACRIGALPDLKLKHLGQMQDGSKSILVYEDSTEEYTVFLTPEASMSLDAYFEKRQADKEYFDSESPLFRAKYQLGIQKVKPITKKAIEAITNSLIKKAGLRGEKKGNRYDVQADHGFRKRFNTILKTTSGVNLSLAERLMGHSVTIPLDNVYLDLTTERLFEEFKKAIPELTIDDSERLKINNENLQKEKSDLENEKQKVTKLEQDMQNVNIVIEEIRKRLEKN